MFDISNTFCIFAKTFLKTKKMQTIIKREYYLNKIKAFVNKPIIKIITGIRRSGKSYLMRQIIDELKAQNIENKIIIYINKELLNFDFIKNYTDLYSYISNYFKEISGKKYIFIDEIQEIYEWEKAISSFFAEEEYDIFITGSNANLLSSEIASLLSGRYIEFSIFTLSYEEFLNFRSKSIEVNEEEFYLYLKYGGFPVVHHLDYNEELIFQYLNSLYNTILLKDVITRYVIRNVPVFENITKYIFDNIGNIFSGRSISNYLKSQNINMGLDTLQNYLQYLENSFIINKVKRYDLKGKRILDIYEKYFLSDIGLKNAMYGYKESEIAGLLENIIFLKLKQSNYQIYIGKFDEYEIDFVAEKNDQKVYIQVAYLLNNQSTIDREFFALKQIKDNYPKYVLSMDKHQTTNNDGIIRMNLIEFLLKF